MAIKDATLHALLKQQKTKQQNHRLDQALHRKKQTDVWFIMLAINQHNNMNDSKAINQIMQNQVFKYHGFIVTVATIIDFVTAWSSNPASSSIMLASIQIQWLEISNLYFSIMKNSIIISTAKESLLYLTILIYKPNHNWINVSKI